MLLLRLAGIAMITGHGWAKLTRLAAGDTGFAESVQRLGFPIPLLFAWAAALAETLCPLLVVLGLFTRPAAAISAFSMAVAAFLRHRAHSQWLAALGLRAHPPETLQGWGNPELALLYLAVFLALALAGGGRFALERLIRRGRK